MEWLTSIVDKIKSMFVDDAGNVKTGTIVGTAVGAGIGAVTGLGPLAWIAGGALGLFAGHTMEEHKKAETAQGTDAGASTGMIAKTSPDQSSYSPSMNPEAPKGLPPKTALAQGPKQQNAGMS